MTFELYLIRHAESENNVRPDHERVEDPSITPRGVQQAEHLADWMAAHPFDLLATSPFRRALQTAVPTANRSGRPVEVWCDIYERGGCYSGWRDDHMRGAAGLSRQAILEMVPSALFDPGDPDSSEVSAGWWGGRPREQDQAAIERAAQVASKLETRFGHSDHRVALITHAEFQRMLIVRLVGQERIHPSALGNIRNAGISLLTFADRAWRIQWFNSVTHLPHHLITGAKG